MIDCGCTIVQPCCLQGQRLFIAVNSSYRAGLNAITLGKSSLAAGGWVTASNLYNQHVKENKKGMTA